MPLKQWIQQLQACFPARDRHGRSGVRRVRRTSNTETLEFRVLLAANIRITSGVTSGIVPVELSAGIVAFQPTAEEASLNAGELSALLDLGRNVVVDTTFAGGAAEGSIVVETDIARTAAGRVSLELRADANISITGTASDLTEIRATGGSLDLVLHGDQVGIGTPTAGSPGNIVLDSFSRIHTNGGLLTIGGRGLPAEKPAKSVTVRPGAVVSTRMASSVDPAASPATGDSGELLINAGQIDIRGQLLAQGGAGFRGGDVYLLASSLPESTTPGLLRSHTTTAQVVLTDAAVRGHRIGIRATAEASVNGTAESTSSTLANASANVLIDGTTAIVSDEDLIVSSRAGATIRSRTTASSPFGTTMLLALESEAKSIIRQSANLVAAGNLTIQAIQSRTIDAAAEGSVSGGAGGAVVIHAVVNGTGLAEIGDAATLAAGNDLSIRSSTADNLATVVRSTADGATVNAPGADALLNLLHVADRAESSGVGPLSPTPPIVAALAVHSGATSTRARIGTSGRIQAGNSLSVSASTNRMATTTADSSPTDGGSPSSESSASAFAVAANTIQSTTHATISGRSEIQASQVRINAGSVSEDRTDAVSGNPTPASSGTVALSTVGAMAINSITNTTIADIGSGSQNNFFGADVEVSATGQNRTLAESSPAVRSVGTAYGAAGSTANSAATNLVLARISESAELKGLGSLLLSSNGEQTTASVASSGAEFGTALMAAEAWTLGSNIARSEIADGAIVEFAELIGTSRGDSLRIVSGQTNISSAHAAGDVPAGGGALGSSTALNQVSDVSESLLLASVTTPGGIDIVSTTDSEQTATSLSSDRGAVLLSETNTAGTQLAALQRKLFLAENALLTIPIELLNAIHREGDRTISAVNDLAASLSLNAATSRSGSVAGDGITVDAGGVVTVRSATRQQAEALADSGAVRASEDVRNRGIGIAVNQVFERSVARIGENLRLSASGLNVQADTIRSGDDSGHEFGALAVSGSGNVEARKSGASALNFVDSKHSASIDSNAVVLLNHSGADGNLLIRAENQSDIQSLARAVSSRAVRPGAGSSVAINMSPLDSDNGSFATVADGAILNGVHSLSVVAQNSQQAGATADAGIRPVSETGTTSGGGIAPSLALSALSATASAVVGISGETTAFSGDVVVSAEQDAQTMVDATASAAGTAVALGGTVAIAIPTEITAARLMRSLSVPSGTLTVDGESSSSVQSHAVAGSQGIGTGPRSEDNALNALVTGLLHIPMAAPYTRAIPEALLPSGVTTFSAANAATSALVSTSALIGPNTIQTIGGVVTVESHGHTDVETVADASSVGRTAFGLGTAAATNLVTSRIDAAVDNSTIVHARGLTLSAGVRGVGDDRSQEFAATAFSGARHNPESHVEGAGAIAMNQIRRNEVIAYLGSDAVVDAGSGVISLSADNRSTYQTRATAFADVEKPDIGVGLSMATLVVDDSARSVADDHSRIVSADRLVLNSVLQATAQTEAVSGIAGDTGLGGSLAGNFTVRRSEASLLSDTAVVNQDVRISSAVQDEGSFTRANSGTAGGAVGLGAAVAVNAGRTDGIAAVNSDLSAGGDVSLLASNVASWIADSQAGVRGLQPEADPTHRLDTVSFQIERLTRPLSQLAIRNNLAPVEWRRTFRSYPVGGGQRLDFSAVPDLATSEGAVLAAAAAAANLPQINTIATVQTNSRIATSGNVRMSSQHNLDGSATADASAVRTRGEAGIGAAASVNAAEIHTVAGTEPGANITAYGLQIEAGIVARPGEPTDLTNRFSVNSTSGAGDSRVGAAGSFAANYFAPISWTNSGGNVTSIPFGHEVAARIGAGSSIESTGGQLQLTSDSQTAFDAFANAHSVRESLESNRFRFLGVGASLATNVLEQSSKALIEQNVRFSGTYSDVNLDSSGHTSLTQRAQAGAAGSQDVIAPAAAIGIARKNETSAVIAGGHEGPLRVNGNVRLTSDHTSGSETSAIAHADGATVALGAALGLTLMSDQSIAVLTHDASVSGDVFLQADQTATRNTSAIGSTVGAGFTGFPDPATSLMMQLLNAGTDAALSTRLEPDTLSSLRTLVAAQGLPLAPQMTMGAAMALNLPGLEFPSVNRAAIGDDARIIARDIHATAIDGFSFSASSNGSLTETSGRTLALGASLAMNRRQMNSDAIIGDAAIVFARTIDLQNHSSDLAHSLHAASNEGGSVGTGAVGALAINLTEGRAQSGITEESQVTTSGDLRAGAVTQCDFSTTAGQILPGDVVNRKGAALAFDQSSIVTQARIGQKARATIDGRLSLLADANLNSTPTATGIAQGGEGTETAASLAASELRPTTQASIDPLAIINLNTTSTVDEISLSANSSISANHSAGQTVSGSSTDGVAITLADLRPTTQALISRSSIVNAAGNILLTAISDLQFDLASAGAANASRSVTGGSINAALPSPVTESLIGDGAAVSTNGSVLLLAQGDWDVNESTGSYSSARGTSDGTSAAVVISAEVVNAEIGVEASVSAHGRDGELTVPTGRRLPAGEEETETASGVLLVALSAETMTLESAGTTISGFGSIGASAASIRLNETTTAQIRDGATVSSTVLPSRPDRPADQAIVLVRASDETEISDSVGAFTVTASPLLVGVGASIDAVEIHKSTQAFVGQSMVTTSHDLRVFARSEEDVNQFAGAASLGGFLDVPAALPMLTMGITTRAFIGDDPSDMVPRTTGGQVSARGNVLVVATESSTVDQISGNLGLLNVVGVGAAGAVVSITKNTEAFVGPGSHLNADSLTGLTTVPTGFVPVFTPEVVRPARDVKQDGVVVPEDRPADIREVHITPATYTDVTGSGRAAADDPAFRNEVSYELLSGAASGVVIRAINADNVEQMAVSGGLVEGFSVKVSGPMVLTDNRTIATIGDGTQVNTGRMSDTPLQSVTVDAGSEFFGRGISGVAQAVAVIGTEAAMYFAHIGQETSSSIGHQAAVEAGNDIFVTAQTDVELKSIAVGLGNAALQISGSLSRTEIDDVTRAWIGDHATVLAGSNLLVSAIDDTDVDSVNGSVALGFGISGLSAGMAWNRIEKDTRAWLGEQSRVEARGFGEDTLLVRTGAVDRAAESFVLESVQGVGVVAHSTENVDTFAASGGISGVIGIAGGLVFNQIHSNTDARVKPGAGVNQGMGADEDQSFSLVATNHVHAESIAGGAAGGTAGVSGALDTGVLANTVTATIGANASIRAVQDIHVVAASLEFVDSDALSASGGIGVLQMSASIWTFGGVYNPEITTGESRQNILTLGGQDIERMAIREAVRVPGRAATMPRGLRSEEPESGEDFRYRSIASRIQKSIGTQLSTAMSDVIGDTSREAELANELRRSVGNQGQHAIVESGAVLNAADDVNLSATDTIISDLVAGGAMIGGITFGASFGISDVQTVTETLVSGRLVAGDEIVLNATLDTDTDTTAAAGQLSIITPLSAMFGSSHDNSRQAARLLPGSSVPGAETLRVLAGGVRRNDVTTVDAAVGAAGAIGLSFGTATSQGVTTASISGAGIGTEAGLRVTDILVHANPHVHLDVNTVAVSGGIIGAGNGTKSVTTISDRVTAAIDENSSVSATDEMSIVAEPLLTADSASTGIAGAAGVTVGLSLSEAILTPVVQSIADGTRLFSSGNMLILAAPRQTAVATPTTSSGSAVTGAAATGRAEIINSTGAVIRGTTISSGTVTVRAFSEDSAVANSDGIIFGLLGIGQSTADAKLSGHVHSDIQGSVAARNVNLESLARQSARASTSAGGVVAGGATGATATSSTLTDVAAFSGGQVSSSENILVRADHQGRNFSDAGGFTAGLLPAGLAQGLAFMSPSVSAEIRDGAVFSAGRDLVVESRHNINDEGTDIAGGGTSVISNPPAVGAVAGIGSRAEGFASPSLTADIQPGARVSAIGRVDIASRSGNRLFVNASASSFGAASIGAAKSMAMSFGTTSATLRGTVENAASVSVTADDLESVTTTSKPMEIAVVAGVSASTRSVTSPEITARVDGLVRSTGAVSLRAAGHTKTESRLDHSGAAAVSIGEIASEATSTPHIQSVVSSSADIRSPGLNVRAELTPLGEFNNQTRASSTGTTLSFLGHAGTSSVAVDNPIVTSQIALGSRMNAMHGDVSVVTVADHDSVAVVDTFSAGIVTLGTSEAISRRQGRHSSEVGTSIENLRNLTIDSQDEGDSLASADAGSATAAGGSGARTTGSNAPEVQSRLTADNQAAGTIRIQATGLFKVRASANGNNTSLLGGEGDTLSVASLEPTLSAGLNDGVDLSAESVLIHSRGVAVRSESEAGVIANASTTGTAVGLSAASATANATSNIHSRAGYLGTLGTGTLQTTGNVTVRAGAFDSVHSRTDSRVIAALSSSELTANVHANGLAEALMPALGTSVIGGNLLLVAEHEDFANAAARPRTGGAASFSDGDAHVHSAPSAVARLGSLSSDELPDELGRPIRINGNLKVISVQTGELRAEAVETVAAILGSGTSSTAIVWTPHARTELAPRSNIVTTGNIEIASRVNSVDTDSAATMGNINSDARSNGAGVAVGRTTRSDVRRAVQNDTVIQPGASLNAGGNILIVADSFDLSNSNAVSHASGGASTTSIATSAISGTTQLRILRGTPLLPTRLNSSGNLELNVLGNQIINSFSVADTTGIGSASAEALIDSASMRTAIQNEGMNTAGREFVQSVRASKNLSGSADASTTIGVSSALSRVLGSVRTDSTFDLTGSAPEIRMLTRDPVVAASTSRAARTDADSAADATATSIVSLASAVVLDIGGNARLAGDNIEMVSDFDGARTSATSAISGGKSIENLHAVSENTKSISSEINILPGSVIESEFLLLNADVPRTEADSWLASADVPGGTASFRETQVSGVDSITNFPGTDSSGLFGTSQTQSQPVSRQMQRPGQSERQIVSGEEKFRNLIHIDGHLVIGPRGVRDAIATIAEDGTVTELAGLEICVGDRKILPGESVLAENPQHEVTIRQPKSARPSSVHALRILAPLGEISGTPEVDFVESLNRMLIRSSAPVHVTLDSLDMLRRQNAGTQSLQSRVGGNQIHAVVNSNAVDATMDVEIQCDVFINGTLNNPAGTTQIRSVMEDILSMKGGRVSARTIQLTADQGQLGGVGDDFLPVELVVSRDLTSSIKEAIGRSGVLLDVVSIGRTLEDTSSIISLQELQATHGNLVLQLRHGEETKNFAGTRYRIHNAASGRDTSIIEVDDTPAIDSRLTLKAVAAGNDLFVSATGMLNSETDGRILAGGNAILSGDYGVTTPQFSPIRVTGSLSIQTDAESDIDSAGGFIGIAGEVLAGEIRLLGGDDDDSIILTAALVSNMIVIDGRGGGDHYHLQLDRLTNSVRIEDSGTSGTDIATILGTTGDDQFVVQNLSANGSVPQSGGQVLIGSGPSAFYTSTLESLTVNGGPGSDVFSVQPSQTTRLTIDGGVGSGLSPDRLRFDSFGQGVTRRGNELHTAGGYPSAFLPVTVLAIDITPPSATVSALPQLWTTREIVLNVELTDPAGLPSEPVTGLASWDLYWAIDAGPWQLYSSGLSKTLTRVSVPVESNHRYWFRAIAVDAAGNYEADSDLSEAATFTSDFDAPETSVTRVTPNVTSGTLNVEFSGIDTGGSGLSEFRILVSIDGAAAVEIPGSPVALQNILPTGSRTGSLVYQGLRDGASHSYRFFSIGRDRAGNAESAPLAPADIVVSTLFGPVAPQPLGIDVQRGQTQRSFVRYLDVMFSDSRSLQELIDGDAIRVERFGITSGAPAIGTGQAVSGFQKVLRHNAIGLDFGTSGIGGLGNAGNGFYRVSLDLDHDGQFDDAHYEFFRLFGDANGNGRVEANDQQLIFEDLNGDGRIDARDRLDARNNLGRKLSDDLFAWLDD